MKAYKIQELDGRSHVKADLKLYTFDEVIEYMTSYLRSVPKNELIEEEKEELKRWENAKDLCDINEVLAYRYDWECTEERYKVTEEEVRDLEQMRRLNEDLTHFDSKGYYND